jgi:hypothetical protein
MASAALYSDFEYCLLDPSMAASNKAVVLLQLLNGGHNSPPPDRSPITTLKFYDR